MTGDRLIVRPEDDGTWWCVTFGGTAGNVLDAATVDALVDLFRRAAHAPRLKAIVLEGAGSHFSYGASVQEHLPAEAARMLTRFGSLLYALFDCGVVVIAAVRGRCLGGGLELAAASHRVVASPDATFAQPEIALGVFPPFASVLLAERIGRGRADDLCLTGRAVPADDARAMGLVDDVAGDPVAAALAWARAHLASTSASSLRFAVRAVRLGLVRRLRADLPALERLYLDGLMRTDDAVEGLRAFLEKRPPVWTDR